MRNIPQRRGEEGVVLVITLMLILAGSLVGLAAMTTSDIEMMISGNQRSLQQVFDAAEAGVDVGISAFFIDAPPGELFDLPLEICPERRGGSSPVKIWETAVVLPSG